MRGILHHSFIEKPSRSLISFVCAYGQPSSIQTTGQTKIHHHFFYSRRKVIFCSRVLISTPNPLLVCVAKELHFHVKLLSCPPGVSWHLQMKRGGIHLEHPKPTDCLYNRWHLEKLLSGGERKETVRLSFFLLSLSLSTPHPPLTFFLFSEAAMPCPCFHYPPLTNKWNLLHEDNYMFWEIYSQKYLSCLTCPTFALMKNIHLTCCNWTRGVCKLLTSKAGLGIGPLLEFHFIHHIKGDSVWRVRGVNGLRVCICPGVCVRET
jgi:hypothetical protein